MRKKLRKVGLVGIIIACALVGGYFGYVKIIEPTFSAETYEVYRNDSDVIGTKLVTSTVPVQFDALNQASGIASATSTYVKRVAGAELVTYNIQAVNASTTSRINAEVEGSNDWGCDTTATSGGDLPLTSEINWTDIGDHMRGKVQTLTPTNASSSNFWTWSNPEEGARKEIVLENMDYECVRLNIAAASTSIWATITQKDL